MKRFLLACCTGCISVAASAQYHSRLSGQQWVDSVFHSLSPEQKIAQLMVVRAHSNLGPDHVAKVTREVREYNVGALCFFQGGPVRQANLTNYYQGIAHTPLLITMDAEWGAGMRLDSVIRFPYQLTLGALSDRNLVYRMGLAVGEQCKRLGVHVNYAPVVDINNNPNNPVIGYRSFGEDRDKVSALGVAYMKGMQDAGIMACAKHFPGHGDVDVDSHLDLPVVNKSVTELDSMELVPFRAVFDAGIGSVMIAHLFVPAVDNTTNKASSISKNNVTGLLREKMNYEGLTFTDALEMKGVAKYFPGGTIAVEALIAGNDMLCLPESVPETIQAVKKAISENRLSWEDINTKVKKVLWSKYKLGLNRWSPIDTTNLLRDLNAKTAGINREVARKSLTVLSLAADKASRTDYAGIPLPKSKKVAYLGIGNGKLNRFGKGMSERFGADVFLFSYSEGAAAASRILEKLKKDGQYDAIIVGVHEFSNRPANNYGISAAAVDLWKELNFIKTETFVFGNVLATKNFCEAWTLVACYQDDEYTHEAALELLEGKLHATGRLPVSVCRYRFGDGIVRVPAVQPVSEGLAKVDSIVADALDQGAFPGCVVMAVHRGKILYHKAFGNPAFGESASLAPGSIFDLASVTKISATTVAVMKLYEEGKLDLQGRLGDYLAWVRGTDKEGLVIEDILLHQAGLVPFIPFYRETIDSTTGAPLPNIYSSSPMEGYTVKVAESLYMRKDWTDTIFSRIVNSPLGAYGRYVYSDNDFIFLGKIVEAISGMSLDQYVHKTFYAPLGMSSTGFRPRDRFPAGVIVPTESEKHFRQQTIHGHVHDEGAAMMGGVSGHAGLFSNAYDLALLYQMLLNGGLLNGRRYLSEKTIRLFTAYQSKDSRRGYGFDKPERDNELRREPYPSALASRETFGHTGFTGTCVWVDPKHDLIYIFLSNRVHPTRQNLKISHLQVRGKIQDAIYESIGVMN